MNTVLFSHVKHMPFFLSININLHTCYVFCVFTFDCIKILKQSPDLPRELWNDVKSMWNSMSGTSWVALL